MSAARPADAGVEPLISRAQEQAPASTIDVGWQLWEKVPGDSSYANVRGGVVVHVDRATDPETGEVGDRYLLVRAHRAQLVWVSLRADQIQADAGRPNAHTLRGVCQVAARELGRPNRRKIDDRRDLELWSLGARLMAVVA